MRNIFSIALILLLVFLSGCTDTGGMIYVSGDRNVLKDYNGAIFNDYNQVFGQTYSAILPIGINDANKIYIAGQYVNKVIQGTSITVSCTGANNDGNCTINNVWNSDFNGNWANRISTYFPFTVAQGGTGQSIYAVGDLLYAPTTTTLGKLADVATGSYLASGGTNTAPTWAILNQEAISGLTTASSPSFTALTLTGSNAQLNLSNDGDVNADVINSGGGIKIRNNKYLTFLTTTGTDDGTRLYKTTADGLQLSYVGNAFIFLAADNKNIVYRDSTGSTYAGYNPTTRRICINCATASTTLDVNGITTLRENMLPDSNVDQNIGSANFAFNSVFAVNFVDLTPAWDTSKYGSALTAVSNIKKVSIATPTGNKMEIDHNSLPEIAKITSANYKIITVQKLMDYNYAIYDEDGSVKDYNVGKEMVEYTESVPDGTYTTGRSIGGLVTANTQALKEANDLIKALQADNLLMKAELCKVNIAYIWCK